MDNPTPQAEDAPVTVPDARMAQVIDAATVAMNQFSTDELVAMVFVMLADIHGDVSRIKPALERVTADVNSGGLAGLMAGMFASPRR